MKYVTLPYAKGLKMPMVGLGTWKTTSSQEIQDAVMAALCSGYRLIDTAFNYNNEELIGKTLKEWFHNKDGKREDVFVTTKLPNVAKEPQDVEKFLKMSLKKLQLDYVDLYLIHMPFSLGSDENFAPVKNDDGCFKLEHNNNSEIWKAMELQVKNGLTKAIGLSNFNAQQIKSIYDNAEIKPSVLQVEIHAYLQQNEVRALCKELQIAVTAYAPLGSPGAYDHFITKYNYKKEDFPDILGHPVVKEIAQKYNKSTGQVLLRHLLQKDIIVIPKSSKPARIKENINLFDFELNSEDMDKLNKLDKGEQGRIFDFLFFKGVEKHPEYPFLDKIRVAA